MPCQQKAIANGGFLAKNKPWVFSPGFTKTQAWPFG
jgi:hypothetical protein